MSADKRSVHTDALATLGTIIDNTQHRDAIHLAVEPIAASENLYPGQHIGIINGKASTKAEKKLGIVDPFVSGMIPEGSMFWLIVYPRQVTSLRHVWSHPDFVEQKTTEVDSPLSEKDLSKKWIEDFANRVQLHYNVLMDGARDMVEDKRRGGYGEYLCFGGLLEGEYVPDEFWTHYEIVTGDKVAEEHRQSFFSCSC
jgi:hypothetical protein